MLTFSAELVIVGLNGFEKIAGEAEEAGESGEAKEAGEGKYLRSTLVASRIPVPKLNRQTILRNNRI